ncbi:MAG TPA: hypothetical protein VJ741_12885 [Solirubrobacteraceae bacterium]|nr:hypothetical protein [Solirubrobacteraceae bacterium]
MSQPDARRGCKRALVACVAVLGLVAATGCGGSDKPAYCTSRAELESSIKGLTDLNADSGLSGLRAQMAKIQTDASALVSSAKSDFPDETSSIQSSVSALADTIKAFPSQPSADEVATLARQAAGAVTSVQNFYNSTSSKCS